MKFRITFLPCAVFATASLFQPSIARGEHQTPTLSPIVVGGSLPYEIEIVEYDMGAAEMPTLQSYAAGAHDGLWVFIAGRTNGLHGQGFGGLASFPPAQQNREVWIVDQVNKRSWHRSLEDAAAGLSTAQVDSLSVTNNQFYQHGDRLYMAGGYGYDRTNAGFLTYEVLTAVELSGIVAWVQGGAGAAADHIRQIEDPLFRITGGAMYRIGTRSHLVLGQDFGFGYNPHHSGNYSQQVRSFEISDDGTNLSFSNVVLTPPVDAYRRRDLNVLPRISRNTTSGGLLQGLVALSGVFTPTNGGWTVPVEIDADGTPSMADPAATETFKQGMHNYHSAKIGMFSETTDAMHMLSFGGISLQWYDREAQQFITDDLFPFISQITSIVIGASGEYAQYLLPEEFPEIYDDDKRLRFGTNAEFMMADGIAAYENDVIQLDAISGPTTIGYIVGGIVADAGNNGNSAASGRVFEVILTPRSGWLADFDNDGDVDGDDFLGWQTGFGTSSGATKADGDADGDGDVDGDDFLIWQSEFGSTLAGAAAAAATPQPAAAAAAVARSYGEVLRKRASPREKRRPTRLRTRGTP